LSRVRKLT